MGWITEAVALGWFPSWGGITQTRNLELLDHALFTTFLWPGKRAFF